LAARREDIPTAASFGGAGGRAQRVLVVDDDETVRLLAEEALGAAGFDVVCAANGGQALDAFVGWRADIVLLDVLMPGLDGFDTCQRLHALPGGEHVPVLMVTGLDDVDSIERAYRVGAADFLTKPINWAVLGHHVRYMLRAARAMDEVRALQARTQALLKAIPDTLLLLDGDAHPQPVGGLEGEAPTLGEVLPREAARWTRRNLPGVLGGEELLDVEIEARGPAGPRDFEARLVPVDADHALMMLRDISDRRRVEVERQRYRQGLEALNHLGHRLLAAARDPGRSHALICDGLAALVQADTAVLVQAEGDDLLCTAASGLGSERLEGVRLSAGERAALMRAMASGCALRLADDALADPAHPGDGCFPGGAGHALLSPLERDGRLVGALYAHGRTPFDAIAEQLAGLLAQRVAVALENMDLLQGLERRVAERTAQLQASNRELESFSYSVAHDLRAPLRGINGNLQALAEDYGDALDAAAHGFMARAVEATRHMDRLIDDLLRLSRVTRSEMHREPVDLSRIAREVAGRLLATAPEREVEMVIAPGLVGMGDAQLLGVVIENLLDNAFKYTARHPRARIEVGARPLPGRGPAFFVADDGAGFDMNHAGKLFGPFQRLHGVREFPGTGIGLATVQRIVQRHGGEVWAEAQVEKGATFFFTLIRPGPRRPS
jgi:signal transduction histidine kinase/FixJ family two-component response regulator